MSTANRNEVMLKQSESVFERRTQCQMIGYSAIKNRGKNILFILYEMREKKIICNSDI